MSRPNSLLIILLIYLILDAQIEDDDVQQEECQDELDHCKQDIDLLHQKHTDALQTVFLLNKKYGVYFFSFFFFR